MTGSISSSEYLLNAYIRDQTLQHRVPDYGMRCRRYALEAVCSLWSFLVVVVVLFRIHVLLGDVPSELFIPCIL